MSRVTLLLSAWLMLVVALPASGEDPDPLLKIVRDGQKKARDQIQSIQAKMRIKGLHYETENVLHVLEDKVEWWQAGGTVRWREEKNNPTGYVLMIPGNNGPPPARTRIVTITEGLMEAGRCVRLVTVSEQNGRTTVRGHVELPIGGDFGFADLWSRAGFLVSDRPRKFFADVLEEDAWGKTIRKRKDGATESLEVLCQHEDGQHIEALLSPVHGYLVKHFEMWRGPQKKDSQMLLVTEVKAFREHRPGIFFPEQVVIRVLIQGNPPDKPFSTTETFIEQVSINQPIPKERLQFVIPEGTQTFDNINQTIYTMGKGGLPSPDAPVRPLRTVTPIKKP